MFADAIDATERHSLCYTQVTLWFVICLINPCWIVLVLLVRKSYLNAYKGSYSHAGSSYLQRFPNLKFQRQATIALMKYIMAVFIMNSNMHHIWNAYLIENDE